MLNNILFLALFRFYLYVLLPILCTFRGTHVPVLCTGLNKKVCWTSNTLFLLSDRGEENPINAYILNGLGQ